MLQYFRDNPEAPVSDEMIASFNENILGRSDFQTDDSWYGAPFIVAHNATRDFLNLVLVKIFAAKLGLPIIKWRLEIKNGFTEKLTVEDLDFIFEFYPRLTGVFVPGMRCFLNQNIEPQTRLANGTATIQQDLIFDEKRKLAAFEKIMSEAT
jgi:hypothetical protein